MTSRTADATALRKLRFGALAILLAIYNAVAMDAHAFGATGHRIIGELAERQLTAKARAEIERLLAGEADRTLASVSTWADEVRDQPNYRSSAPLHYVNFPRKECTYRPQRDCPDGRCIVAALERYASELNDARRPLEERREALKWVVHLVGDIHQPLHAAYADDRGATQFQVFYAQRGTNLHAMWDTVILQTPRRGWRKYADLLAQQPVEGNPRWSAQAPRRWAEESCRLVAQAEIYPPHPGRLGREYAEHHLPLIERRLVLAAGRLAALLNAAL